MKVKAAIILALALAAMLLIPLATWSLAAGTRHSGTVVEVGRDSLVVDERGLAGREQKLHIKVTSKTRVVESQRNPHASSAQDEFTDKTIALSDIKMGDVVVVDISQEGKQLVAESVTVTLRGSQN